MIVKINAVGKPFHGEMTRGAFPLIATLTGCGFQLVISPVDCEYAQ
jgi:hypothetical protein